MSCLLEQFARRKVLRKAHVKVRLFGSRYLLRFPKHVAGMVLVDGWLDSAAYVQALQQLFAGGDGYEKWAVSQLTGEGRNDKEEARLLRQIFLTSSLQEPRDSEAYRLWRDASHETGFATVPDLAFDRHTRVELPTCFYFPDPDVQPFSGGTAEDLTRIRQSFKRPTPVTAVMRESKGFAHVEEPEKFLGVLQGFLRATGIVE